VAESVEVLIQASILPNYAHPGDAGADLHSAEAIVLLPGTRALVGTGVSIALPDGYAAFVVPRSGLAIKHGITIVNAPGTVDAGYRGQIKVALLNTDQVEPYSIQVGDRIAQLIVMPVARATFIPVDKLPGSQRGASGFGSTGIKAGSATRIDENSPTSGDAAPKTGETNE
jgi:dUTP pyrophosphatase